MKTSSDRMITTHTGSLPRTDPLTRLLVQREHGKEYDKAALDREVEIAMDLVVDSQAAAGVDVGNDGEMPRVGFSTYVTERMTGFGGESHRKPATDMVKFPEYAAFFQKQIGVSDELARVWNAPQAVDVVHYDDTLAGVKEECAAFAACLAKRPESPFVETFMTAASPGIVSTTLLRSEDNPAYGTDAEYVLAVARELKKEYEYVVSQGHVLQLDAPDMAMERVIMYGDHPLGDFLERVELHVEAINVAVADIPRDRVRLHVCWGNWQGPHQDDVPVEELLPILYNARVGAFSIPLGNPRHAHEAEAFRKHPLPGDALLIPGLIDVTTNYLEHPELVCKRILEVVDAVGDKERVIAGTDCGFGTFASYEFVARDVVWGKLQSLSEGAALATRKLWG